MLNRSMQNTARRRAIGLIGAALVGAASSATAQDVVASRTATLRVDPATDHVIIEVVNEDGELIMVRAASVEIATADTEVITGTLDLSLAGEIELCPPVEDSPQVVIGVTTEPLGLALAAQLCLDPAEAIMIAEVTPGFPAEAAGICAYDVITAVDGSCPVTQDMLAARIADCTPGEIVTLQLLRGGQQLHCDVQAQPYVDTNVVVDATTRWLTVMPEIVTTDRLLPTEVDQRYALLYRDALLNQEHLSRYYIDTTLRGLDFTESCPRAQLRSELETLRENLNTIETLLDQLDAQADND